jgi:mannose-1-phosphate guanylyltransferase
VNSYPSDHIIGNADLYEESMQEAIEKQRMVYSNLRYRPYKPETGYGYIERDAITYFLSEKPIKFRRDFYS